MRIFISGICGFVGSKIALSLLEMGHHSAKKVSICGIDNLSREGSWRNLDELRSAGVMVAHGDVRSASDLGRFGGCEWVIDAAANPSVLAGISEDSSSRSLVDVNLLGTINQLEYCKRWGAGLILLSSSRVYSIHELAELPIEIEGHAYHLNPARRFPEGVTARGIGERFSTRAPISLYGATKLAAEALAMEYHHAFGLPVWINRCGVLAGATQFGKADQGIFSFWLASWYRDLPLRYIGFGGSGYQVRDVLHPRDLTRLLWKQLHTPGLQAPAPRIIHASGGMRAALSLQQVSQWCRHRWGDREVQAVLEQRAYDLPWLVLDNSLAGQAWDWEPVMTAEQILEEIAAFVESEGPGQMSGRG
jgi:CDP-paratose 2-epimerase